ncbi:MAG: hypothetical protein KGZ50_10690 [Peptococcaceae bacterium]|nr:hypothetical protein [Peptococcaceae bacterium]
MLYESIARSFNFLEDRGFRLNIEKVTNVYYELTYHREFIKVFFSVEEMESYFYFSITLMKDGQSYSISLAPTREQELDSYKGIKGKNYRSIFDFTDIISQPEFESRLRALFPKVRPFALFGGKNAMKELLDLHKKLLETALNNIMIWIQEDAVPVPE